jgi:hypothetical protein
MANLNEKVQIIGTIRTYDDFSFEELDALKTQLSYLTPSSIIWTCSALNGELSDNKELRSELSEKALKDAFEFLDKSKTILLALHAILRPDF